MLCADLQAKCSREAARLGPETLGRIAPTVHVCVCTVCVCARACTCTTIRGTAGNAPPDAQLAEENKEKRQRRPGGRGGSQQGRPSARKRKVCWHLWLAVSGWRGPRGRQVIQSHGCADKLTAQTVLPRKSTSFVFFLFGKTDSSLLISRPFFFF